MCSERHRTRNVEGEENSQHVFQIGGTTTAFLIVVRAAKRIESVRLEDEKGLDKKWHPVENRSAPVSAFPYCDVPPLRIAGIVCEETRWRKKKQ